jgi:hypothetical protein
MLALRLMMASPALCIAAATLEAQADSTRPPSFYVGGGISEFDFSGTGTTPALAVRASWDWRRYFVVEVGTSIARIEEDFGTHTLVIPDVQLQAQLPAGNWRPYAGVGAGIAMGAPSGLMGAYRVDPALSTSAGVRVWFRRWLAARGELRVHGFGSRFQSAAAEWTGGLQWRFK